MKTNKIFIRFFVAFLLGHTATATCKNGRRFNGVNGAALVNKILSFSRGGGDGDTLTQQRRNTTKTVTPNDDTASWFNKLQLLRKTQNSSRNTTTSSTTTKKGELVVDSTKEISSDTIDESSLSSPIIQSVNTTSQRTGWFQQRQPWRNSSSSNVTTTTLPSNENTTIPTKAKRRNGRKSIKELDQNNTSTTPTSSNSSDLSTTAAPEIATKPDSNNTNTTSQPPPAQQQQQILAPGNSGMIVIGPGLAQPMQPQQQQYYRGQPVIIRGTPTTSNPTGMTGVVPNSSNSVVIVLIELFSSVLGKAMYIWFFTWLTKRMAQQEEGMIMPVQHYVWERLNDRYSRDAVALQTILREPPLGVSYKRWYRQHIRQVQQSNRRQLSKSAVITAPKLSDTFTRTVVVVELSEAGGGFSSSTINFKAMPDVVSFLLQQQRQHAFGTSKATGDAMPIEIVFIVNSPGGEVSTYGLASAQMRRLKNQPNITTTVCVDKYAASGGFMIASQADKLVAAPFATIGSVGVIMEGLNFYELAKRYGVQPLVLKAGESKNPLSQWGPVTRQNLAQQQSQIEKVHEAFKEFVTEGRPGLVAYAQQVMDGSVYLGIEARKLGLIDVVMTTDEYIFDRIEAGDRVLRLHQSQQGRFNRQQRSLSPLDILPHLRSWLSSTLKHFDINDNKSEL